MPPAPQAPRRVDVIHADAFARVTLMFERARTPEDAPGIGNRVYDFVPVGPLEDVNVDEERDSFVAPVRSLLTRAADFVDLCLRIPGFGCCSLGVALEITVDGQTWCDRVGDDFPYVAGWYTAVQKVLLADKAEAGGMFCEMSSLELRRDGPRLVLWDGMMWQRAEAEGEDPAAFRELMPIDVDLRSFAIALCEPGRQMVAFFDAVRAEILRRGISLAELEERRAIAKGGERYCKLGDTSCVLAVLAVETETSALAASLDAIDAWLAGSSVRPEAR